MNLDLSLVAPGLTFDPAGYWVSRVGEAVSYPDDGHDHCFSIEEDSFWFRHRNAVITDLARHFPPDGYFFDVGGGNGYVARGLESAGFPCVLLEPGGQGAANAVARGVKNVVRSTLEDAHFEPASLGAVGLFDVIDANRFCYGR